MTTTKKQQTLQQFRRVFWLLRLVKRAGAQTTSELFERATQQGYQCSRRQLQRDLACLLECGELEQVGSKGNEPIWAWDMTVEAGE